MARQNTSGCYKLMTEPKRNVKPAPLILFPHTQPRSGASSPKLPQVAAKNRIIPSVALGASTVLAIGAAFALGFGKLNSAPASPEDSGQSAYHAAVEFCRAQLQTPSDARFSVLGRDKNTGWKSKGENQWEAYGFIEAQDGSGGKFQNSWEAIVGPKSDGKNGIKYFILGKQKPAPKTD